MPRPVSISTLSPLLLTNNRAPPAPGLPTRRSLVPSGISLRSRSVARPVEQWCGVTINAKTGPSSC